MCISRGGVETRRTVAGRLAMVHVVVVFLLLGGFALGGFVPAAARDRVVRLDGRVQWVASQTMVVSLDTGGNVNVDLVRVPQDQYATLSPNERVTVIGVITDRSRRVIGTSIMRGSDSQAP
jgi:hypothetical protein